MKKFFKWFGIIVGAMVVLFVIVLLVAPMFLDIQQLKPRIEKTVRESTGRAFVLGGELELSLFPWAGVTVKDVSLGSPEGFKEKSFATFSEFEVRMKLLPLLSRDVQVKHIVLKGLRLVLEKTKDGKTNWEFSKPGEAVEEQEDAGGAFPIKAIAVGEISVTDSTILYIDNQANVRKELSDVNARVGEISFDRPIRLQLSAKMDNTPLSLEGSIGPLGKTPGAGRVEMVFTARAFDMLELHITGQVTDPATSPAYELSLAVSPFSPRRLIKEMAPEAALSFSDASVMEKVSLDVVVSGDTEQIALSKGKLILDDTTATFQAAVKEFTKPDISWKVHVDALDLDRYLPKTDTANAAPADTGKSTGGAGEPAKTDYAPMRSMVLDGSLGVDELKAGGGTFREISMKVTGAGGRFRIDPLSMKLYEGGVTARADVDVTGKTPQTGMELSAQGIQIGPLLKDFMDKEFITGTTLAQITLSMTGDDPAQIKQTLNGNGTLQFADGAIRGVNLLGMIQNLAAAFGSGSATESKETAFSEFQSQFTITRGVVNNSLTKLSSPVLSVDANGTADLVKETLNFRVTPTYINPLNKKADGRSISGTLVPVLVTGTFSEPKFRPDLKEAAKQVVTDKLTEIFGGAPSDKTGESETPATMEESVKGLLNKLPFGK